MDEDVSGRNSPARGFVTATRAINWEESLISGNGTIGALVRGDPADEVITFSHERLFLPVTPALPPIDMTPHLERLRAVMLAGGYQEAADFALRLAEEHGYGGFRWTDPFVPAFDLRVTGPVHGALTGYWRGTDFETGEASAAWQDERGPWWRRLFVSRADEVAVLKVVGPGPGAVNVGIRICAPPGPQAAGPASASPGSSGPDDAGGSFLAGLAEVQRQYADGLVGFRAIFRRPHERAVAGYQASLRVVAHGGEVAGGPEGFTVTGADEVVALIGLEVLVCERPGEGTGAISPALTARLNGLGADYGGLLARHAAVHGGLFGRARLDLGGRGMAGAPSEDLLEKAATGVVPAALVEKVFDAGRYAIISSCGALPPNLQGVWAGTYLPPWSGDYTHNGNVQTALAALLSTNTPELLLGYFSYLESMMADFRENSRLLFGCRGVYAPSRFSTHGLQNHFNETWCHEFWTAGAGWAARLFYDYWLYTGDEDFLVRRALPFMREVADFYEDFLFEDAGGSLMFVPSVSPENNPGNSGSQATINATMDIAVARDLFRNLIELSRLRDVHVAADVDAGQTGRWEALLARLPAYAVDADGALAEWAYPALRNNQAHRHASHLYPLLYEVDADMARDQAMVQACRRAVELRMAWRRQPGHGEMAFGLVWLGVVAAHLGMADVALETLTMLAAGYWRPSLVSSHDVMGAAGGGNGLFNVDICGGLPALVAEMLVQSTTGTATTGTVLLLPACPAQWESGGIEGIACRGQVLVERLSWEPGHVSAWLRSPKATRLEVVLPASPKVLRIDGRLVRTSVAGGDRRALLDLEAGVATTVEAWMDQGGP